MNPFKVGDIVRPNPEYWHAPENLKKRFKVIEVNGNNVRYQWNHVHPGILPYYEFVLCEESIIDRLLEKYS